MRENGVLKNAAKLKIAIDPGKCLNYEYHFTYVMYNLSKINFNFIAQLWRFDGDKLVNKQFPRWKYSSTRWQNLANDKEGPLIDKSNLYRQLTTANIGATGQGAQVSLTTHHPSWVIWRKSRDITFDGDLYQWFTLYHVISKRYLTAGSPTFAKIQSKLHQPVSKLCYQYAIFTDFLF